MRRFRDIIEDIKAPSTQSLWLNNGELKVYGTKGWTSLNDTSEDRQELEEKVDSLDKEVGQIKKELSVFGSEQGVVELEIGNSAEIKAANLNKLRTIQSNDHTFFTDINYGYGTASWLPSTGGNALIITNEGHAVKYSISIDGEVSKISEFTLKDNSYTLPAATKTTIGGVKAGINIVDIANPDNATAPQVAGTLNTLLGQLRNAGILIS